MTKSRVIYGGTVSKVLSPALRLGWIVAPPPLTDGIIHAKFLEDVASEALGQLTLARFIESGVFARHLRRVRPIYRSRRDRVLAALNSHLPELRSSGEAAGLHLLLRLPAGLDPGTVSEAAARHGIQLEEAALHWVILTLRPPPCSWATARYAKARWSPASKHWAAICGGSTQPEPSAKTDPDPLCADSGLHAR